MEKISSLSERLADIAATYPHLHDLRFIEAESFAWNKTTRSISYDSAEKDALSYLLHEFGHAVLDHGIYRRDIELIKMERDAWKLARELAAQLALALPTKVAEDALDTYRDWLHARSTCPHCQTTGIQINRQQYQCVACSTLWRVNEARTCALRRHITQKHPT